MVENEEEKGVKRLIRRHRAQSGWRMCVYTHVWMDLWRVIGK